MELKPTIPPETRQSLQRLMPYMSPELRNDPQRLEAILLFFKLGGDKLARIVIDAYNQTQRLQKVQEQRMRLRAEMLDALEEAEKDEDDDDDDDDAVDDDDLNDY
ncbi:hypothetical protein [Desulfatitalea alkaliphila]|uniref:Uncharacterized protein n=1 Tax=Desulfatitalea alkaliphila TaxID=2929485 RepID=A0AA41R4C4_9BACT|nr:hypothetical protein [Desulfatitalea alkaliphila]MCJ8499073.1 hypothetical protein [Desulfatitalea alkaliphila]